MNPEHILTALTIKRTLGTPRAAAYLKARGFTCSQAIGVLARPIRVVVPYAS